MVSITLAAVVAVLATLASAAAVPDAAAAPKYFNLTTIVTKGNAERFGGLHVQSFHTGAGTSAVVGKKVNGAKFCKTASLWYHQELPPPNI